MIEELLSRIQTDLSEKGWQNLKGVYSNICLNCCGVVTVVENEGKVEVRNNDCKGHRTKCLLGAIEDQCSKR